MASRAAAALRLESLFDQQSESLEQYGRLLRAQEHSLQHDDPARFEAQLEAERALLDRLDALRRVSDALEPAYRQALRRGDPQTEAARARASASAAAVAARSGPRRLALDARREAVGNRLRTLRRVVARASAASHDVARMLDISR